MSPCWRSAKTRWTAGHVNAIAGLTTRNRRATCRPTWWVMKTSTPTASGAWTQNTATSGFRTGWRPTGPPIAMATGPGLTPGAGPGSTMRHGAMRCRTTGGGPGLAVRGAGSPARRVNRPCMPRHSWRLWAERTFRFQRPWVAQQRPPWAGFRWPHARSISLLTRSAAPTSTTSTAATP